MSAGRSSAHDSHAELAGLIETLHETYQRLRALTDERTDAIVHPASGTTYLLPHAQGELRRMENIERRHAAERSAILDALPAQVALLDRDGRIVAVNQAWRRFAEHNGLGDGAHALGWSYLEICEQARGPGSEDAHEVAAGVRRVLSSEAPRYALEYPCHSPDGQRWFLLTVTPVGGERPAGAVVMHLDVTERFLAHARAEEWRRRLERLVDQAKVGVLVHRNFTPILANRELARLLGYGSPAEILALGDCRVLFAEDERERLTRYNEARLRGEDPPALYRVKGQHRDGRKLIMENRAFTIEWGEQSAVCAMLTDITARLETEEQLRQSQRLDAVGQLTGGVAHDFNNLLTVILGNVETLAESLTENQRLRLLAEMTAKAAERGAELTHRLLAFARRQPLAPQAVDVNHKLAGMDGLLRRTLGEHIGIELVQGGGLWQAMVDAGQLENAILNLCINARDAMPEGGRLTIETANVHLDEAYAAAQSEVEPGQYVMVAVSDTGAGMDEATLGHAFEPFFTTKEVGEGSGLGLSMVYGFVKQSRGHVRIYSEHGQGTAVRLYLPRAEADEGGVGEARAEGSLETGSERILLVEDDDLVRDHVSGQLSSLGYQVVAVRDGAEALEALKQIGHFDLLFTDVVMPGGMGGGELAERAAKLRPGLPVLFTSGYAEQAVVHHGRLDRGVHLLQKPYRKQELAAKVRKVLERREERG